MCFALVGLYSCGSDDDDDNGGGDSGITIKARVLYSTDADGVNTSPDAGAKVYVFYDLDFNNANGYVTNVLYENKAHKNQWYATMAKLFQYGHKLNPDTDTYDNSNLTEAQIESSRIVKFAAAVQPKDKSILYIKVATEVNGQKQPLSAAQLTAFKAYLIDEVPDAGVRIEIINAPADAMRLEIDIYYNALVLDDTGKRLDGSGDTTIQDAIRNYLSNLSFNGLYTNQSLVDVLQTIEGVEQAELIAAYSRYGTYTEFQKINARSIPYAGYYAVADNNLIINFIANEEYI